MKTIECLVLDNSDYANDQLKPHVFEAAQHSPLVIRECNIFRNPMGMNVNVAECNPMAYHRNADCELEMTKPPYL